MSIGAVVRKLFAQKQTDVQIRQEYNKKMEQQYGPRYRGIPENDPIFRRDVLKDPNWDEYKRME